MAKTPLTSSVKERLVYFLFQVNLEHYRTRKREAARDDPNNDPSVRIHSTTNDRKHGLVVKKKD
jgi:hypothetical protein